MAGKLMALLNLKDLTFLVSVLFFGWLIYYFYTGLGGPRGLAVHLVPIALIIHMLLQCQEGRPYPRLPLIVNQALVGAYILICAYAFYYFFINYEDIAIWRQ